jgi:hypothetical protein
MIMKHLITVIGLLGLLAMASGWADASVIIDSTNGELRLEAQEAPLKEVLEKIRSAYEVEITGLEGRNDEPVTFSYKGETLEDLLKRLFRCLGETNYAFAFMDGKIRRVTVLPTSKIADEAPSHSEDRTEKKVQKIFSTVVRVKSVIERTRAQELGLMVGDLIISYAGVRIDSTLTLIRETRKKTDEELVEMTVVRNRELMQFYLERGFIGVRIHTLKIPKEELDGYYANE